MIGMNKMTTNDLGFVYTPPPEERRKPLLKALKEAWDAAPSMRLTQLLICARVFPHCDHTSRVWSDYDEETTKKLLAFAAMVKMEKECRSKRLITPEEIAKNNYDLTPSRYFDKISESKKTKKKKK